MKDVHKSLQKVDGRVRKEVLKVLERSLEDFVSRNWHCGVAMIEIMTDAERTQIHSLLEELNKFNENTVSQMYHEHSHIIKKRFSDRQNAAFIDNWLDIAIRFDQQWLIELSLSLGANINAKIGPGETRHEGLIETAANMGRLELVKRFLDLGGIFTQVLKGRLTSLSLIGATIKGHKDIVEFLVERGAPVDSMSYNDFASVLDFSRMYNHREIEAFLLAKGARPGWQIRGEPDPATSPPPLRSLRRHLKDAVELGELRDNELIPIVISDPPVTLMVLEDQNFQAFITNGVSNRPLPRSREEDCEYVELLVQVDSYNWTRDSKGIVTAECWPLQWLFRLADQLHSNQFSVGFDTTIETGKPLGDNTQMTAWWFVYENENWNSWLREDGHVGRIFRIVPVYPEEVELIRKEGGIELIRRFAANQLNVVLDPSRPNLG